MKALSTILATSLAIAACSSPVQSTSTPDVSAGQTSAAPAIGTTTALVEAENASTTPEAINNKVATIAEINDQSLFADLQKTSNERFQSWHVETDPSKVDLRSYQVIISNPNGQNVAVQFVDIAEFEGDILRKENLYMHFYDSNPHSTHKGTWQWARLKKDPNQDGGSASKIQWTFPKDHPLYKELLATAEARISGEGMLRPPDFVLSYDIPPNPNQDIHLQFAMPLAVFPNGVFNNDITTNGPYDIQEAPQNLFHFAFEVKRPASEIEGSKQVIDTEYRGIPVHMEIITDEAECVNDLRHEISEFSHSWQ